MYTEGLFGVCTVDAILKYPGPKYVYWYDYISNFSTQNIVGYYEEYLGDFDLSVRQLPYLVLSVQ